MTLDETLHVLRGFPPILRDRVSGLSSSALLQRPAAGGFSLFEHFCHLRDYETEGVLDRARRILGEEKPFLPDFNSDRDYGSDSSSSEAFDAWSAARERSVAMFSTLSLADLNRPATLGSSGEITLGGLADVAAEHDKTHLDEIDTLLGELR